MRQGALIFNVYYLSLYAPVAVWISFFPLWLRAQGLSEADVGLCLALGSVAAVLINPLVGALADTSGQRKPLLLALIVAAALSSLLFFGAAGFAGLLAAYLMTRLFSASLIPLSESIVLANLRRFQLDFGGVRSWGSSVVVVLSPVLGLLVERVGINAVIVVLSMAYVSQALLGLALPGQPAPEQARERPPSAPISEVLKVPGYGFFLGSASVSQACHGIFYAYSTFYWLASGFSATTIGALWSLGVTVEIIAFACSRYIRRGLDPAIIIAVGCAAGSLRWGLLGFSGELWAAIVVQLLQGATLGLSQVGSAYYLNAAVPPRILSSGTGVFAACTGLLTATCVFVGGRFYPEIGGRLFLVSAVLCLLGTGSALMLAARRSGRG